jgi:hypothetical protein
VTLPHLSAQNAIAPWVFFEARLASRLWQKVRPGGQRRVEPARRARSLRRNDDAIVATPMSPTAARPSDRWFRGAIPQPPPVGADVPIATQWLDDGSQTNPLAHAFESAQVEPQTPLVTQRYGAHSVVFPDLSVEPVLSLVQVAPCTHLPDGASQVKPFAQSVSTVQVVAHAPLSHVNGTHDEGAGALQLPAPSHVDAPTT